MTAPLDRFSTAKKVLIIILKNALLGILTSAAITTQWHDLFNFDNMPGVYAVLKMCANVIVIKEAIAWGPWLLRWASTKNAPDDVFDPITKAQIAGAEVQQKAAEVQVAAAKVQDAVAEVKDSQAQLKKEDTHGIT